MQPEIQSLLEAHAPYFSSTKDGKIQCSLNGHTFPARFETIEAFVKGKKYRKLKERHEAEQGLKKYEPFITQSLNFENMLFCALTNQLIHKSKAAIREHMKGRRFLLAKERFQSDQLELWIEPSPEEMRAALEEAEAAELAKQVEEQNGDENENGVPDFMVPVDVLEEEEHDDAGDATDGMRVSSDVDMVDDDVDARGVNGGGAVAGVHSEGEDQGRRKRRRKQTLSQRDGIAAIPKNEPNVETKKRGSGGGFDLRGGGPRHPLPQKKRKAK